MYTLCHYLKHPTGFKLIVNISQDLVGSVAWDPETLRILDEKPSLFYILLFTPRATLAYPVYIPGCCKEERGGQANSRSYQHQDHTLDLRDINTTHCIPVQHIQTTEMTKTERESSKVQLTIALNQTES